MSGVQNHSVRQSFKDTFLLAANPTPTTRIDRAVLQLQGTATTQLVLFGLFANSELRHRGIPGKKRWLTVLH